MSTTLQASNRCLHVLGALNYKCENVRFRTAFCPLMQWLEGMATRIPRMAETLLLSQETPEGVFLEPPSETADRRTAAEKRFDEQMEKREAERIAKMTAKSHRQRVAEFNEHLGKLTEHMVQPPLPTLTPYTSSQYIFSKHNFQSV